jgi:Cu/Ag efflux protein CusF
MKRRSTGSAFAVVLVMGLLAAGAGTATSQPTRGPADATMTRGEVRKVDKANRRITLAHEDIRNLDMPGMTMVFAVTDPALLDRVKPGDRVRFHAEKANGALVVTNIERAK